MTSATPQSAPPPSPQEEKADGENTGGGAPDKGKHDTTAADAPPTGPAKNHPLGISAISDLPKKSTRRDWKKAANLVRAKEAAVAKVSMKNKIGTKAKELDDDGFLKILGLATQRALRDFGKARTAEERGGGVGMVGVGIEGTPRTPDEMEFKVELGKDSSSSEYTVRQPGFVCHRIENEEFVKVRAAFGVSERQYYSVFGLQEGRTESDLYVIGSDDAAGKSASFFFLSPDQRYILKSCTSTDVKVMLTIIRRYREYVESQCPSGAKGKEAPTPSTTLLPRCLGLYSFDFDDPQMPPVVMVAMTNFFGGALHIDAKYDLKGSVHGRLASDKERTKTSPVFKDLDWLKEGRKLRFPTRTEMRRVQAQLDRDTEFLRKERIIDYSLLVGLHEMDSSDAEAWKYTNSKEAVRVAKAISEKDQTIAYYGIVDFLTPYGLKKRGETFVTGTVMCCRDVSCQPPEAYRRRFLEFCKGEILACDEEGERVGAKASEGHEPAESVSEVDSEEEEKYVSKGDQEETLSEHSA